MYSGKLYMCVLHTPKLFLEGVGGVGGGRVWEGGGVGGCGRGEGVGGVPSM